MLELLESDSTGGSWRLVRRDTLAGAEADAEYDLNASDVGDLLGGRPEEPTYSPGELRWGPGATTFGVSFDTTRVELVDERNLTDDQAAQFSRFSCFVTTPVRGISYSSYMPGAPESDFLNGPICYVDLERKVKRCLTLDPDTPARDLLFTQYRNFVLLPTIPTPVILDDKGRVLLRMSEDSRDPVWVPCPRP